MTIEINLQKLERGTHEEMVTVRRGGKIFQRRQKVGKKDVKESKLEELHNIFANIQNKLKLFNTKLDNTEKADIEPDVKERKIKKILIDQNKLKADLNDVKTKINEIKKGNKDITTKLESKESKLKEWKINHEKLQNKLDSLKPELIDIMKGGDTIDVRAARLKKYKEEFKIINDSLKASKAELKKINKLKT